MLSDEFSKETLTLSCDKQNLLQASSSFAAEAMNSFAYSALQSPLCGAAQFCDKVTADAGSVMGRKGTELAKRAQFMAAPSSSEHAEFGSAKWHAQQVGSAGGLAADIILASLIAKRICGTPTLPALGTPIAHHPRREIAKTAFTGAMLGGIFTPVNPDEIFWQARLRNATVQGLTFGTLTASAVGMKSVGKTLTTLDRRSAAFLSNEIVASTLSGLPAGLVHSQSDSLLSGKGLASIVDTGKSMYTFASVGGILGIAGKTGERTLKPDKSARLKQPLPESPLDPTASTGNGVKLTEFVESKGECLQIIEEPNGTRTIEYKSGERQTKSPDGTVTTVYPREGKTVTERADGTIITLENGIKTEDIQHLDVAKNYLHREIRTTDSKGNTTTRSLSVSRCGQYEVINGSFGKRTVDVLCPGSPIAEVVEFADGPLSHSYRVEEKGFWAKLFRSGDILKEGRGDFRGEVMPMYLLAQNAPPALIQQLRTKHASETFFVKRRKDPTYVHQLYRPNGTIQSEYIHNSYHHEGRAICEEIAYPDGSFSRQYWNPRQPTIDLELSCGVRIGEVPLPNHPRAGLVIDHNANTYTVRGPDGSTIGLTGGFHNFNGPRELISFENTLQRIAKDGSEMKPFDIYDVSAGAATRHLYRDGSMTTVAKNGRNVEVKYSNGTVMHIHENGRVEIRQPDGTMHLCELDLLVEHRNGAGQSTVFVRRDHK